MRIRRALKHIHRRRRHRTTTTAADAALPPPPPTPPTQRRDMVFYHPFTMMISGPTACEKTTLVKNLLQNVIRFLTVQGFMMVLWKYTDVVQRYCTCPLVLVPIGITVVMLMTYSTFTSGVHRHNESTEEMGRINGQEGTIGYQHQRFGHKIYRVTWYSMLSYLLKRPYASSADFSVCEYNNCILTLNRSRAAESDAVMFEGRKFPSTLTFKRPVGQIWIYAEHEGPARIQMNIKTKRVGIKSMRGAFNWTMTYDKLLADIHFPYGELRKYKTYVSKDYLTIAANKTKGALIVTSNCHTPSKRMQFISELKKYSDIEVFGECGKNWTCGKKLYHDECFDILNNTYAFYLAFENDLCEQYFSEKLFENFKYDILIVTRGGKLLEASSFFPKGSVIDSDAFANPQQLGKYLTELAQNKIKYAEHLEVKSQYYSINYRESYQRALCDICYRLNHQDVYYKIIPDVLQVLSKKQSCRKM